MPTHLVKTLQEARRRAYLGCVYRTSCGRRPICFILLCSTKWDSKPAYVGYIEGFQERSNVEVRLSLSENLERLPQDLELMIFRVVQECLTNIHRHSGSATAAISLSNSMGKLTLQIRDQGEGMPLDRLAAAAESGTTGVGLRGMRERVKGFGGEVEILSDGKGTLVRAVIPYQISAPVSNT
jgi:signal transduction histidine kinase